jgi:hypothetical protein
MHANTHVHTLMFLLTFRARIPAEMMVVEWLLIRWRTCCHGCLASLFTAFITNIHEQNWIYFRLYKNKSMQVMKTCEKKSIENWSRHFSINDVVTILWQHYNWKWKNSIKINAVSNTRPSVHRLRMDVYFILAIYYYFWTFLRTFGHFV